MRRHTKLLYKSRLHYQVILDVSFSTPATRVLKLGGIHTEIEEAAFGPETCGRRGQGRGGGVNMLS